MAVVLSVVLLVHVASSSAQEVVGDVVKLPTVTDVDLRQPVSFWIARLSAPEDSKREKAADVLDRIALILIANYQGRLPILYFEDKGIDLSKNDLKFAKRFRMELREARPDLIRLLKKTVNPAAANDVEAVALGRVLKCIGLIEPDGSSLLELRNELPATATTDHLILQGFLTLHFRRS